MKFYTEILNQPDKFTETFVAELPHIQIRKTFIYRSLADYLKINFNKNDNRRKRPTQIFPQETD